MSHMKLRTVCFTSIVTWVVLFVSAVPSIWAEPIPTKVRVRAVSKDAKIIGSSVGGARITIRNLITDEILARGVQMGGTGDTQRIMVEPRLRGATVYDAEGAAAFDATLLLEEPTKVEISAEGPLAFHQATQRASKTMLLIPGQDVLGEGVILEIHGFNVTLLSPGDSDLLYAGESLSVRAHLTMTCGCPIEPGGMWDANKIRVVAQLTRNGQVVEETPLEFAGETSHFSGELPLRKADEFELRILAMEPSNANFGMYSRRILVRREQ